jgi:hypothetical protein
MRHDHPTVRGAMLLVAMLMLQGCLSTHVEPTEGSRAQIRFVSTLDSSVVNVSVLSFGNEQCENRKLVAALSGAAVQHNRKKLGMPLGNEFRDRDISEMYVQAGTPLIFSMGVWTGNVYAGTASCRVTKTFQPVENQMYEATFLVGDETCAVSVQRIEKSGNDHVRVPEKSARKTAHTCSIDGIEKEPAS